jgi:hypothetical protein
VPVVGQRARLIGGNLACRDSERCQLLDAGSEAALAADKSIMGDATVFRVRPDDLDRYQAFLYDLPEVTPGIRHFDGTAKEEWWEPVPLYSDAPRLEAPDIWHLVGSAAFVMSSIVAESLGSFLHPVGELLPVRVVGARESFEVLNILRDVNCLNPEADRIDDLEIYSDFLEHRLPESGLFKVPQLDTVDVFYLERSDDGDTFRDSLDRHGYSGLRFEPVWTSDGSIRPLNLIGL